MYTAILNLCIDLSYEYCLFPFKKNLKCDKIIQYCNNCLLHYANVRLCNVRRFSCCLPLATVKTLLFLFNMKRSSHTLSITGSIM